MRGFYTAASGILVHFSRIDAAAGNVANWGTAGFRRAEVPQRSFADAILNAGGAGRSEWSSRLGWGETVFLRAPGLGAILEEPELSNSQGGIDHTGRPEDLALDGAGFFVVEAGPRGSLYTRRGDFQLDGQGRLVTPGGYLLMGEKGPIIPGGPFEVEPDGTVTAGGAAVDRILVVDFPAPEGLSPEGEGLYGRGRAGNPFPAEAGMVQGAVELSNVDLLREMVSLMAGQRAYQAVQRALRTHDELLGKAIAEIPRV
ncbi:MAG: flagellar hook basal-body protein [Firmicutes bacterium]|nr:flagellar hook basal-body protein [Bacillota bacterium]